MWPRCAAKLMWKPPISSRTSDPQAAPASASRECPAGRDSEPAPHRYHGTAGERHLLSPNRLAPARLEAPATKVTDNRGLDLGPFRGDGACVCAAVVALQEELPVRRELDPGGGVDVRFVWQTLSEQTRDLKIDKDVALLPDTGAAEQQARLRVAVALMRQGVAGVSAHPVIDASDVEAQHPLRPLYEGVAQAELNRAASGIADELVLAAGQAELTLKRQAISQAALDKNGEVVVAQVRNGDAVPVRIKRAGGLFVLELEDGLGFSSRLWPCSRQGYGRRA